MVEMNELQIFVVKCRFNYGLGLWNCCILSPSFSLNLSPCLFLYVPIDIVRYAIVSISISFARAFALHVRVHIFIVILDLELVLVMFSVNTKRNTEQKVCRFTKRSETHDAILQFPHRFIGTVLLLHTNICSMRQLSIAMQTEDIFDF